jgi:hypothetical protein
VIKKMGGKLPDERMASHLLLGNSQLTDTSTGFIDIGAAPVIPLRQVQAFVNQEKRLQVEVRLVFVLTL